MYEFENIFNFLNVEAGGMGSRIDAIQKEMSSQDGLKGETVLDKALFGRNVSRAHVPIAQTSDDRAVHVS